MIENHGLGFAGSGKAGFTGVVGAAVGNVAAGAVTGTVGAATSDGFLTSANGLPSFSR